MKQLLLSIFACFVLLNGFGQAPPQGINYQAVALDAYGKEIVGVDVKGQPILDKAIRVRFSIIATTATGILEYEEVHSTNTDQNGLFNVIIGQGTPTGGTGLFPQINWGAGYKFLKVEIDINNGSDFKDMGTQQLWSVPYALYTKTAGNGVVNVVDNGNGTSTTTLADGTTFTINSGGAQGPQGPVGPQGPAGAQGAQGLQGPAGANGVGITNIVDNGDGTLTITYGNGSTLTTSDLTGPAGAQGAQGPAGPQGPIGANGVGITNVVDNGDGTLTITYGNGSTVVTSDLTGPTGAQGAQGPVGPQGVQGIPGAQGPQGPAGSNGVGITSTVNNGNGTYTFNYSDGSTFTTGNLTGPAGAQGVQGIQGLPGAQGPQGPTGPAGAQGPAGPSGTNGVGITSTVNNGNGTYTFNYSDGSTFTTGNLTGPQGPAGLGGTDAQTLSISGNNITISNGNTITIPSNGNTLDQAYDQGGPGAGRLITADAGAVQINNSGSNAIGLQVNSAIANSKAIEANQSGSGVAIRATSTLASNTFAAIQAETNSTSNTNSAILGQTTGVAYAVAGQVASTATANAGIYGNNLRTTGGHGVYGIGFNGVVGSTNYNQGFGVYGNNTNTIGTGGDGIGVYGLGFNGIYGQTTDVNNGWAGYFTADLGCEGDVWASSYNVASDLRLKTNVVKIESALEKIAKLNGTHYTITLKRKVDGKIVLESKKQYGVIAQEVEKVFPEMIHEKAIFKNAGDDTVYKTVEYTQLVPVLLEAIKELKTEVDALKQEIELLKKQ